MVANGEYKICTLTKYFKLSTNYNKSINFYTELANIINY